MLFDFLGKVNEVDIAVVITANNDDREASHNGARWIGSMCGRRNKADITMGLVVFLVVSANAKKAGIFAL
jgi:hypothetical protein